MAPQSGAMEQGRKTTGVAIGLGRGRRERSMMGCNTGCEP